MYDVTSSRSTVFLASASPLDCQLLAASLQRNHLQVIGWALNSREVISAINNYKPDAAVIGVCLQDGALAGFSALREIRLLRSHSRVVMLLDASEPGLVVEAFRQGAAGVFSRTQKSSELRKCIHSVLAGQIWANQQEIGYLIEALRAQPSPHLADSQGLVLLTNREEQVVSLVVNGLTNREVAEQLRLSEHTVKNYMFSIFEKVGVSTRVELVLYALSRQNHSQVRDTAKTHNNGFKAAGTAFSSEAVA